MKSRRTDAGRRSTSSPLVTSRTTGQRRRRARSPERATDPASDPLKTTRHPSWTRWRAIAVPMLPATPAIKTLPVSALLINPPRLTKLLRPRRGTYAVTLSQRVFFVDIKKISLSSCQDSEREDALCRTTPATPPEDVEIAGMRIALHRLLHKERQAVHPAAHVLPHCQPDPNSARNRDHRRCRRAAISAFSAAAGYPAATSARVPSGNVMMAW
jgi:hypothetical protein